MRTVDGARRELLRVQEREPEIAIETSKGGTGGHVADHASASTERAGPSDADLQRGERTAASVCSFWRMPRFAAVTG